MAGWLKQDCVAPRLGCGFHTGNDVMSCDTVLTSSWLTRSTRTEVAVVCGLLSKASDAGWCLCPRPVCIADTVSLCLLGTHWCPCL